MQNETVSELFRRIAQRYDRMNRLMTFGLDRQWRSAAVRKLRPLKPKTLLDLAAGTGDFAQAASKLLPSLKQIYLVDITPEMLKLALSKKPSIPDLEWHFIVADAQALPFPESFFDAIVVGYGLRNFSDRTRALCEIYRVLRPGGMALILETGIPRNLIWRFLFWGYFRFYVPLLGALIAKDKKAYVYLSTSTAAFPHREEFLYLCKEVGFVDLSYTEFLGGVSILYKLRKL
ncbi:MAG: bifunctional demethylmenaquinone methyltransferase/2-methoxy-6-polyprenyl-1,4-benzoquinol methylase UbiE [Bacteroidia bacterium]|nr:bifunctional demethylmenaquinone methyltransferase/2-methoxy-6-polyprenyl-1,4-benzoquinol methylase UbiE [Bacteroidia bacterium]MDW8015132.1 bifunctional demethylmenaquinone methyltransferase/2-methoxy-6-polyprenyl-1,4-benzoquinol methylase UbiE [Bacteroidia bacterium]